MRIRKSFFSFLTIFWVSCLLFAEVPFWWNNPHKDDQDAMYERGSADDCDSEQQAVLSALKSAKAVLMERIGIAPALSAAGVKPSPEYALINCEEVDSVTDKHGRKWAAWVLIRYPQKEKQKLLARWNSSAASIRELKKVENRIPVQFSLSLGTASGYTEYREGEKVVLTANSDRDAYLVLLDHQSDGTTVLLFPNKYHPDCLIRRGEKTIIPDPSYSAFRLEVSPPFGDDRVEAIASTRFTSLQERMKGLLDDLPGKIPVASASRGIFVHAVQDAVGTGTDVGDVQWSRAELILSTYQYVEEK